MGVNSDPVTLHKYLYANADPVSYTDPTGQFSIGSLMSAVNTIGTLATRAQAAYNIFQVATGAEELSAKDMGFLVLMSISPKVMGKVFKGFKPCNSFSADTLVSTEYGLKPISEIAIGDNVWAFDEKTGEKSLQEVTHLIVGDGTKKLTDITLPDGESITTTDGHLFYSGSIKEWKYASDIEKGDVLANLDGLDKKVLSTKQYVKNTKVYNLTVDKAHTFYVSSNEVLAHNTNVCTLPLRSSISMGGKFKDHFQRHKGLLSAVTGKNYRKVKTHGQEFLDDLRKLVDTGRLKFKGRGTLGKGQPEVNIYSGEGMTLVLKDSNEWVTLLKAGEGMSKKIMMVTK